MVQISLLYIHTYIHIICILLLQAYCVFSLGLGLGLGLFSTICVRWNEYLSTYTHTSTYCTRICRPLVAHTNCNLQRKSEENLRDSNLSIIPHTSQLWEACKNRHPNPKTEQSRAEQNRTEQSTQ